MIQDGLHDIIGNILLHILMTDQQIPNNSNWDINFLPGISFSRDNPLYVDWPILLPHLRNSLRMANEFYFLPGSSAEINNCCSRKTSHPKKGINLFIPQSAS